MSCTDFGFNTTACPLQLINGNGTECCFVSPPPGTGTTILAYSLYGMNMASIIATFLLVPPYIYQKLNNNLMFAFCKCCLRTSV